MRPNSVFPTPGIPVITVCSKFLFSFSLCEIFSFKFFIFSFFLSESDSRFEISCFSSFKVLFFKTRDSFSFIRFWFVSFNVRTIKNDKKQFYFLFLIRFSSYSNRFYIFRVLSIIQIFLWLPSRDLYLNYSTALCSFQVRCLKIL